MKEALSFDEYPKHSSYTRVLSCFRFISLSDNCIIHVKKAAHGSCMEI